MDATTGIGSLHANLRLSTTHAEAAGTALWEVLRAGGRAAATVSHFRAAGEVEGGKTPGRAGLESEKCPEDAPGELKTVVTCWRRALDFGILHSTSMKLS